MRRACQDKMQQSLPAHKVHPGLYLSASVVMEHCLHAGTGYQQFWLHGHAGPYAALCAMKQLELAAPELKGAGGGAPDRAQAEQLASMTRRLPYIHS